MTAKNFTIIDDCLNPSTFQEAESIFEKNPERFSINDWGVISEIDGRKVIADYDYAGISYKLA